MVSVVKSVLTINHGTSSERQTSITFKTGIANPLLPLAVSQVEASWTCLPVLPWRNADCRRGPTNRRRAFAEGGWFAGTVNNPFFTVLADVALNWSEEKRSRFPAADSTVALLPSKEKKIEMHHISVVSFREAPFGFTFSMTV